MYFLLFCLAAIGLTHIVVDSHIVWKLKHWLWYAPDADGRLVLRPDLTKLQKELHFMGNCYQCSGFWAGLFLGVVLNGFDVRWWWWPAVWIGHAFTGSYLSMVGAALINYLDVVRADK